MKKFLYISLAAFGLAACAEKMDEAGSPADKGELETSYIAVSLKSDDTATRASEDFDYGEAEERYVKTVHFFLFNDDGSAFAVNAAGNNYLSFEIESNGTQPGEPTPEDPTQGPNVSDVKDKILVFNNYKGEYPTHIAAVLNWTGHMNKSYTLESLYNVITNLKDSEGNFVMSNSVYADLNGEVVNAIPVTIANIGKSAEQAKANPVEIYVERVSAKVRVKAAGNVTGKDNTFDISESVDGTSVYVKVLGWELYNDYEQSILIKHIYPETWGSSTIGFLWNDPNRFRSYWTASLNGEFPQNSFDWANDRLSPADGVAYCGENTTANRTKVIIKAQLVKEDGTAMEVARWYGYDYAGELALRTEVTGLLTSELFYKQDEEYKSITPDDLKVVEGDEAPSGTDIEAYEVFFQLSDSGLAKDWFVRDASGSYQAAADDAVNAILDDIEPALLYKEGQTYYSTDIRHMGEKDSASEFGVVRNHIYNVNITNIIGFGTPVYDPETDFETPERPEGTASYVAAEVRILSWKVVDKDYSVQ